MVLLTAALLMVGKPALAQKLSLSAGVFSVQSEYRGSDPRILPMPIVNYDGDVFFIKNTEAGLWLWNDGTQKISVGVTLLPQYFRASKSDDSAMKKLDNRNIIVLGTLGYELNSEFGSLRLSASSDITGTSDGFLASASYAYPVTLLRHKPRGIDEKRPGPVLSRCFGDSLPRSQCRLRALQSLESFRQLENHLPRR